MLKLRWLLLILFVFPSGVSFGQAESQFDGKWYFEDELLVQFLPDNVKMETDSEHLKALTEQFFNNTYMLINIKEKKMEMVVFGEETETDFFEIVEASPTTIRIKPFTDNNITVFTLLADGRLEMQEESSGFSMYFVRNR